MDDNQRSRAQLLQELDDLRWRVGQLEKEIRQDQTAEAGRSKLAHTLFHQRQIINQVQVAVFSADLDKKIVSWNQGAECLFGYSQEEVLGQSILLMHPPEDHNLIKGLATQLVESGELLLELPMLKKSGEQFYAQLALSTAVDQEGVVYSMIGYAIDISQRKLAQDRLARINQTLLSFGVDPLDNINRLTALVGELMGATCALYNRLDGALLVSTGHWNTPLDYNPVDQPEGHICYDVIRQGSDELFVVRNLPQTPYAQTDPNVASYQLETYVGQAVRRDEDYVGSLCVVFQDDYVPSGEDEALMGIVATAIGVEENRQRFEQALQVQREQLEEMVKARTAELTKANNLLEQEVAERAQAELVLRESEARLRFLTDHVIDVIWILDLDGRIHYATPSVERLLGYKVPELMQYNYQDVLTPASWAAAQENKRQILQNDPSSPATTLREFVCRDGSTKWCESAVVFLDDDETGKPDRLVAVIRDVSERMAADAELRRAKREWEEIFQAIGHPTMILSPDQTILDANRATVEALGGIDLDGRKCFEVFHQAPAPPDTCPLLTRGDQPGRLETQEMTVEALDGVFLVSCTPVFDETGTLEKIIHISTDITDRVRAEQALQASEERFRRIIENTWDVVVLTDEQGYVTFASNSIERVFGFPPADYLGVNVVSDYGHPDDLPILRDALQRLIRYPEQPVQTEVRARHKNGSWVWIESAAVNMLQVPSVGAVVSIFRDISERKEAENKRRVMTRQLAKTLAELKSAQEQLVRQERLAAVGQLAAGIAHDFNNILAVFALHTQLAMMEPKIPPKMRQTLAIIDEQTNRAANLIQQVLDFSRKSVIEREMVDLAPLLWEQHELLQRTLPENIKIELALTDGSGDYWVNADLTRMQQMLINLALNARDAMPDGGVLELVLARYSGPISCIDCEIDPVGDWVQLQVIDTGIGISSDVLPHIFEPFFTTHAPLGSGLGLAQVYGIVTRHGGHIDVQTEVGRGTTITVSLPAVLDFDTRGLDGQDESIPQGQGQAVLVVEDDPKVRQALVMGLQSINYQPIEAENGFEALSIFEEQDAGIALVISDLVMPEMGGLMLCRALKQLYPAVKMVVITGYPLDEGQDVELEAAGVIGWLNKPIGLGDLARVIDQSLA